ncbi:glycosyltransferase family 2 protein [Candidatus Bathyarchaeota archaeon A05DMB-2]|jgi:cellulose synthase/poly-beta-1,6-N-acetylglucosamine synthase-like glycosyltransferase|nr:glycosyltransferase family 2 protein [Candidatus Bathyarchaeota archaeon A05DMB-2]
MILDFVGVTIIAVLLIISLWSLYNVPILATGIKDYCKKRHKAQRKALSHKFLPTFSIVVPVKNEEKVIGRLLTALSKLAYPSDKQEILIIEDGSTDSTPEICMNYAREHPNVKILHRSFSNGKPSALNYGLAHAKGELIAIFDADNVPDPNALMTVLEYFQDPAVAAVQGRTMSINSKENMLTQFISYEEAVWCEAYLRGKDVLNLFVHLKGSCQFIRRDVLNKLKGFNETALSEDMEISAKLTENNFKIRYASDVVAWQESPSDLKTLFKQRTRWFRGTMEVAFKYGRLMSRPSLKNFDAETTLWGPFILIASLVPYTAMFWAFFQALPFNVIWTLAVQFATLTLALSLFVCGLAMVYITKPRSVKNILWLPFVYCYWSLQAFIALYAALLIFLRRPRQWTKTDKKGASDTALSVK